MNLLYWLLAAPTALLAGLVIVMNLAGRALSQATPIWLSLLMAAVVIGLLVWARTLGTQGGRPGLAVLMVLGSWVLFCGVMLVNGLMHQKVWN